MRENKDGELNLYFFVLVLILIGISSKSPFIQKNKGLIYGKLYIGTEIQLKI